MLGIELKTMHMLDKYSTKSGIGSSGCASVDTAKHSLSVHAVSIFYEQDEHSTCFTGCLTRGIVSFHFNFSNGCTETSHNGFL